MNWVHVWTRSLAGVHQCRCIPGRGSGPLSRREPNRSLLLGEVPLGDSLGSSPRFHLPLCSVCSARSELRHASDGSGDQSKHVTVQQPRGLLGDPVAGDLFVDGSKTPLTTAAGPAEKHCVTGFAAEASQRG